MKPPKIFHLVRNMGFRYAGYRVRHEVEKRMGLLQRRTPINPPEKFFLSLSEWRQLPLEFLFTSRDRLTLPKQPRRLLEEKKNRILGGIISFFHSKDIDLGKDYDWVTNPETGYKYSIDRHWSQIDDYDAKAGDIKYVWEKSRFSHLLAVMRYDYHHGADHSEWIWKEIDSWIVANPVNCGPNYRCSQEISLRILNWCFVLFFYRDADTLTEDRWKSYQNAIYWQLHHIYAHIDFSRIAVRNNHAITETAILYLSSYLFPFIPESHKWAVKGKKWLEAEIAYQIYKDGTFLQFSMNYHRVIIQVLTLIISLVKQNGDCLSGQFYDRAYRALNFLFQCQELTTGQVPNYGANDGALFFPLTDSDYRDYRPQLNSLHLLLTGETLYQGAGLWTEDADWWGISSLRDQSLRFDPLYQRPGVQAFTQGGYYLIRDGRTLTFLRCGRHKDRPSQADNLHLDLWIGDKNVMRDAGSYKYNADADTLRYFMGTASHNTVMVQGADQMLKGARFIWYYWTQSEEAILEETEDNYIFKGVIRSFGHIDPSLRHERIVTKKKGSCHWIITDKIIRHSADDIEWVQIWNPAPEVLPEIMARDEKGVIAPEYGRGWFSPYYGIREETRTILFRTQAKSISTEIRQS